MFWYGNVNQRPKSPDLAGAWSQGTERMLFFLVNNLNKTTKYFGGMVKPNVCHFSSQQKGLFAVYNSFFGNKDGGFQLNLSDVSRIFMGPYGLLWKGRTCFFSSFPPWNIDFSKVNISNDGFHTWPCGRRAGGPIVLARYDRNRSFFLFGWYGWWRFNLEPNEM